ncbi:MAG: adenylate/guanylate cyclase domain-containing protein [Acidimicrobiales bacterium]
MDSPPATHYAKTDGLHIAYQVVGDGPVDLVMVSGTPSHVELQWQNPLAAYVLERLSTFSRVITFDKRGSGLSDSAGTQPSLEDRMDDVRAVMDAAGSARAVIFGQSEGSPMSMLFAATYPGRTASLALYGSIVRWVGDDFAGATPPQKFFEHLDDVVDHWGEGQLAEWFAPTLNAGPLGPLIRDGFGAFERAAMSPGSFRDLMRLNAQIDVRAAVPAINVPALVMHRAGDRFVGVEQSRWLAANLPNSTYLELEGEDHLLFAGDVEPVLAGIEELVTGSPAAPHHDRVLATVLFTDIVGSTELASRVGDAQWVDVLGQHARVVRDHLARFAGREINTTGDGFVATFDGPGRAVQCALALSRATGAAGVPIRCGLHTGEIELAGDDIAGVAVHIAARVQAAAAPGEVLASRTVKDLVVGSGVQFADRGTHQLKGVPDEWQLFAASLG